MWAENSLSSKNGGPIPDSNVIVLQQRAGPDDYDMEILFKICRIELLHY
jgi:hypothetical protein